MIAHLALALLSTHPAASDSLRREPAVRVWLSDSTLDLGKVAQVFVRPRYEGYLAVLHADAEGHIRVLYPVSPADQIPIAAGATFQVSSGVEGRSISVNARGTGMVLAAWSATPFSFDDLRYRDQWDYENSLLLQPSAGNAFAALLDIADRIAGDRPYGYDLAVYGTPGAVAKRPKQPKACADCLTKHYVSRPSDGGSVATPTYAVDCSSTTLVDSFCGVSDNRVYYSYVDNSQNYYGEQNQAQAYPASYDYPLYDSGYYPYDYGYYPGSGRGGRFRDGHKRLPRPAQAYIRPLGLQQVPGGGTTPPPVRYRPTIEVRQPYAPSRPSPPAANPPAVAVQAGWGSGNRPPMGGGDPGPGPGTPMLPPGAVGGGNGEQLGGPWGGFVGASSARARNAPPFGNTIPQPFGNTIPQPFGNRISQPFGGGVAPAPRAVMALPPRGGGGGSSGGGRRR